MQEQKLVIPLSRYDSEPQSHTVFRYNPHIHARQFMQKPVPS